MSKHESDTKHQADSKATLNSTRAFIASQMNRENKSKIEAHTEWLKSIEDNKEREINAVVDVKRTKEVQETLISELPDAVRKILLDPRIGFVFQPTDTINTLVRGCSPLLVILMLGMVDREDIVELLLRCKDIRADHMVPYTRVSSIMYGGLRPLEESYGGSYPLDLACRLGFTNIIPRLIQIYPDALHRIIKPRVLKLLQDGTPERVPDGTPVVEVCMPDWGRSTLSRLAGFLWGKKSLELVKVLLEMGADINQRDESGTYLEKPVRGASTFHHGPPGQEGQTILFYAALTGNVRAVKYFLEGGAKVNLRNKLNLTALQMVEERPPINIYQCPPEDKAGVIKVLRAAQDLFVACQGKTWKDIDEAERCLKRGASVNQCNSFGATPLHLACAANAVNMVSFLVSQNASIITPDDNGITPLTMCTPEARAVMLKLNHDFTKTNKLGKTAIDCIAQGTQKGQQEIRTQKEQQEVGNRGISNAVMNYVRPGINAIISRTRQFFTGTTTTDHMAQEIQKKRQEIENQGAKNAVMNYIQPEIDKMIFKVRQLFGGKPFNDVRLLETIFRDELGYKPFARTELGRGLVRRAMDKAMRSAQIQRACLRIERDIAQERTFAQQWETWQKRYHLERPLAAASGCGPGTLVRYR